MTDQELLRFAAIAGGELMGEWIDNEHYFEGVLSRWNPLLSDADAFRLMVKLALSVYPPEDGDPTAVAEDWKWDIHITEVDEDGDYLATTRRAIVRAAAEIGRNITND